MSCFVLNLKTKILFPAVIFPFGALKDRDRKERAIAGGRGRGG